MKLPQTSEYALRIMVQMVLLGDTPAVTSQQLAVLTAVPEHFLSKVLRRLVVGDLLVSKKGVHGGFVLARSPQTIGVREILIAAGYPFEDNKCLFGWEGCHAALPCPLHHSWSGVKGSFRRWADETTLASIAYEPTKKGSVEK